MSLIISGNLGNSWAPKSQKVKNLRENRKTFLDFESSALNQTQTPFQSYTLLIQGIEKLSSFALSCCLWPFIAPNGKFWALLGTKLLTIGKNYLNLIRLNKN